jgi:internalin A
VRTSYHYPALSTLCDLPEKTQMQVEYIRKNHLAQLAINGKASLVSDRFPPKYKVTVPQLNLTLHFYLDYTDDDPVIFQIDYDYDVIHSRQAAQVSKPRINTALTLIKENKLTQNRFLDLGQCKLTAVPPEIAELPWLEVLVLSDAWMESDGTQYLKRPSNNQTGSNKHLSNITPLAALKNLRTLYLNNTQISNLEPLSDLVNLQFLDLGQTPVSDLSPLSGLTGLQLLDIHSTKVTDLSPLLPIIQHGREVSTDSIWQPTHGILVKNCPITTPPAEILAQGHLAILNYFTSQKTGFAWLREAKVLLLGEPGAGKTSLLRRLYQPEQALPSENELTQGIDIHQHSFQTKDGRKFRLNVWDFGGHEIYHATHQFFLTRRSLYILVDDTRKNDRLASDPGFKYWLDFIQLWASDSPILLYQNERRNLPKEIDFSGIQRSYPAVKERYRGNLEHPNASLDMHAAIEYWVSQLPHIEQKLPAAWLQIRQDIEQLALDNPFISQQEYFNIYQRHLPFQRDQALHLSSYLHDLGIFLHFQDHDLLARTVILQSAWATDAAYLILNDPQIKQQAAYFTRNDCKRLWHEACYADMHPELLNLMERFELCYQLPHSMPERWFVPQLLPISKPEHLHNWGKRSDLILRYCYPVMPKGIINRLMVRQHRFVSDPEQASLSCVLFQHEKSALLAELLNNGNEIELRARGPQRKDLIAIISAELDAINEGFGLRNTVRKFIPCICPECGNSPNPHLFAEEELRRRAEKQRWPNCPISFEDVDVTILLADFTPATVPDWSRQSPIRAIRIFLASSNELTTDRVEIEMFLHRQNDHYYRQGVYFEIIRWEDRFQAMSVTTPENEINQCDLFVSLFFTKAQSDTDQEFDAAVQQFKTTGKPYVFTFFRDSEIELSTVKRDEIQSLWTFQEKLKQLGHCPTTYTNIEHLKLLFAEQLRHVRDLLPV